MTRVNFKFWVNDDEFYELVKYLKELTAKEKFTDTIIEILEFVRKNSLEHLKSIEALRREKLVAEIADLKSRTAHRDTIKKPTPIPIPATQSSYVPPEERKIDDIIKFGWNKFVNTLRKHPNGWTITCKLCPTGFPQLHTEEEAIERFKTHLEENHETELLSNV